jgi:hypothetical protein
MGKLWLIFLIFLGINISAFAVQDSTKTLESMAEEVEKPDPKYEYWRKDYYKNIAVADSLASSENQGFEEMFAKYQSSEFEYIESISDKLSMWTTIKNWINKFFNDLFPDINASPGDWFYNMLGIAGVAFVIFLLYKFFFSGRQFILNPNEDVDSQKARINFVERNLLEVDLNTYIKEAVASNNYALAIRYQQLLNIQLLAKKNVIYWNQAKTNMELMDEISQLDLRLDFKKCTALFDYVWFGDFTITANKFEEISKQFQEFQRRWS